MPRAEEDTEDELSISTTEEQIQPINQTNNPNEQERNSTLARNPPENCTSETTTCRG